MRLRGLILILKKRINKLSFLFFLYSFSSSILQLYYYISSVYLGKWHAEARGSRLGWGETGCLFSSLSGLLWSVYLEKRASLD
jgi:hypothetical protein